MFKEIFFKNLEKHIGFSLSKIKDVSPGEINRYLEMKSGKKIRITTEFPFIGRGNVLRDGIITHDQINQDIDNILG